jgi:2-haloacid dehalogenase
MPAPNAPITAVTFDLGGVLIDWNPRYLYRSIFGGDDAAMERFLTDVCNLPWNALMDAGKPFAEAVSELIEAHPEDAELIRMYHLRWAEMLGTLFDDTVEIVRELKPAGYPVYALSNWSTETFGVTRERFPFLEELDGILISGDVRLAKADVAIFREFLRRYDLDPATTVYVDDWDLNVASAASVGIHAIHFVGADDLRVRLREMGLPLAEGSRA